MTDGRDLELLLRSDVPIIVIETSDESRLLQMLTRIALASPKAGYRPLFRWTITDGLQRLDLELEPQRHAIQPQDVLGHIRSVSKPGIFVLLDFHPFLADPVNTRLLKDIALSARVSGTVVVLVSHQIELPRELSGFSARFRMQLPDADERRQIVMQVAEAYRESEPGKRVTLDPKALQLLVQNLSGLDRTDAERLARSAIVDDGALTRSDLPGVMKAKYSLLNRAGTLTYEYDTTRFSEIAGFSNVKRWLADRRDAFTGAASPALDMPRGILLLGVQGCGKSVAAKAAAGVLGVPLLRLDFGALYNKYHGETERNLREALDTADVMSPCVLWIDEVEKGIASDDSDTGTSRRVLGTFLTWMAERKSRVFLVATANDIQALPPELVRKGRFDEVFFVDLPRAPQRQRIFEIHLRKRGHDPSRFDLASLAKVSSGFSGAEIEQSLVSALYAAHARSEELTAAHIVEEIGRTRPLSVLLEERIQALRSWAVARTVPAD
jgi:SpoVK/Ycf46/Vps4 family AAA+-type ATPase